MLTLLENADVPAICSSIHQTNNGQVAIGYDNAQVASQVIEYLYELGHRCIAIVHGPANFNDRTRLRLEGIHLTAERLGASVHCYDTTLDVAGGSTVAKHILQKPLKCTAILCLSDVIALGVLFEANQRNIAIPDAVSLMGFDDLDWAALCHPALTTIRLPVGRMGRLIADALVERLEHGAVLKSIALSSAIVERASTTKYKS